MASIFFAQNVGVVLSQSLALRLSRSSICTVGATGIISAICARLAVTFSTTLR